MSLPATLVACASLCAALQEPGPPRARGPVAHFAFEGDARDSVSGLGGEPGGAHAFVEGLSGQACRLDPESGTTLGLPPSEPRFTPDESFSVQLWVRTTAAADQRMVLLSNKRLADFGLDSQRAAGWAFLHSHGTWAWNLGAGSRRLTYERDNGESMPLGDGRWHQLALTYDSGLSVVRLCTTTVKSAPSTTCATRRASTSRATARSWSADRCPGRSLRSSCRRSRAARSGSRSSSTPSTRWRSARSHPRSWSSSPFSHSGYSARSSRRDARPRASAAPRSPARPTPSASRSSSGASGR